MRMEAYVSFSSPLRGQCPLEAVAKEEEQPQQCACKDRERRKYVICS